MKNSKSFTSQREDIEHHLQYLISEGAKALSSGKEDDWKSGEIFLQRASNLIAPLTYLEKIISSHVE